MGVRTTARSCIFPHPQERPQSETSRVTEERAHAKPRSNGEQGEDPIVQPKSRSQHQYQPNQESEEHLGTGDESGGKSMDAGMEWGRNKSSREGRDWGGYEGEETDGSKREPQWPWVQE